MTSPKRSPIKVTLHVTFEKDVKREVFVAHCLEFDLVTVAKTMRDVEKKMLLLLQVHLEHALEEQLNPFNPAPDRYWEKIHSAEYINSKKEVMIPLRTKKSKIPLSAKKPTPHITYTAQPLCFA